MRATSEEVELDENAWLVAAGGAPNPSGQSSSPLGATVAFSPSEYIQHRAAVKAFYAGYGLDIVLAHPVWTNAAVPERDSCGPSSRKDDQLQQKPMLSEEICRITAISFHQQKLTPSAAWQHESAAAAKASTAGCFMRLTLQPAEQQTAMNNKQSTAAGRQELQKQCIVDVYPAIGGAKFMTMLELPGQTQLVQAQQQQTQQQSAQQPQLQEQPVRADTQQKRLPPSPLQLPIEQLGIDKQQLNSPLSSPSEQPSQSRSTSFVISPNSAALAATTGAVAGPGRRRARAPIARDSDYDYESADFLPSPSKAKRPRGVSSSKPGVPETMSANKQKLKVDWNDHFCHECLNQREGTAVECDGTCLRMWHVQCLPEELRPQAYDPSDAPWYCVDCRAGVAECAVCGDKGTAGSDVYKCTMGSCGRYYHPTCLLHLREHNYKFKVAPSSETSRRLKMQAMLAGTLVSSRGLPKAAATTADTGNVATSVAGRSRGGGTAAAGVKQSRGRLRKSSRPEYEGSDSSDDGFGSSARGRGRRRGRGRGRGRGRRSSDPASVLQADLEVAAELKVADAAAEASGNLAGQPALRDSAQLSAAPDVKPVDTKKQRNRHYQGPFLTASAAAGIPDDVPFTADEVLQGRVCCPSHYCHSCHLSGDSLKLLRCWTCPRAYHSSCLHDLAERLDIGESKLVYCPWCKHAHKQADEQVYRQHGEQPPPASRTVTSTQRPSWWNSQHMLAASRAALQDSSSIDLSALRSGAGIVRSRLSTAVKGRPRKGSKDTGAVGPTPGPAAAAAAETAGTAPGQAATGVDIPAEPQKAPDRRGRPARSSAAAAAAFLSQTADALLGKGSAADDSGSSSDDDTDDVGGVANVQQLGATAPSSPSAEQQEAVVSQAASAGAAGDSKSRKGMFVRIVPLFEDEAGTAAHCAAVGMAPNTPVDLIGKSHWHFGTHYKGGGVEFQIPVAGIKLHSKLVVHEDGVVTIRPMHLRKHVTPPLLNGKALVERGVCYELNHGDIIDIGGARFRVEWHQLPPGSAPTALATRPASAGLPGWGSAAAALAAKAQGVAAPAGVKVEAVMKPEAVQAAASPAGVLTAAAADVLAFAEIAEQPAAAEQHLEEYVATVNAAAVALKPEPAELGAGCESLHAAAAAHAGDGVAAAEAPSAILGAAEAAMVAPDSVINQAKRSAAAIEDELARLLGQPLKKSKSSTGRSAEEAPSPATSEQQDQQELTPEWDEQAEWHQQYQQRIEAAVAAAKAATAAAAEADDADMADVSGGLGGFAVDAAAAGVPPPGDDQQVPAGGIADNATVPGAVDKINAQVMLQKLETTLEQLHADVPPVNGSGALLGDIKQQIAPVKAAETAVLGTDVVDAVDAAAPAEAESPAAGPIAAAAATVFEPVPPGESAVASGSTSPRDAGGPGTFRPAHRSRKQKHVTASVVDPLLPAAPAVAAATAAAAGRPGKKPGSKRGRKPGSATSGAGQGVSTWTGIPAGNDYEANADDLTLASLAAAAATTAADGDGAAGADSEAVKPLLIERRTARRSKPIFAAGSKFEMYAADAVVASHLAGWHTIKEGKLPHGGHGSSTDDAVELPVWGAVRKRGIRRVYPVAAAHNAHNALRAAGVLPKLHGKKQSLQQRQQQRPGRPSFSGGPHATARPRVDQAMLANVLSNNAAAEASSRSLAVSREHFAAPPAVAPPAPAASSGISSLSGLNISENVLEHVLSGLTPELQQVFKALTQRRVQPVGAAPAQPRSPVVRDQTSIAGLSRLGGAAPQRAAVPAAAPAAAADQTANLHKLVRQLGCSPQLLSSALRSLADAKQQTGLSWEHLQQRMPPEQRAILLKGDMHLRPADALHSLADLIDSIVLKQQQQQQHLAPAVHPATAVPAPAVSSQGPAVSVAMLAERLAAALVQPQQRRLGAPAFSGPPAPPIAAPHGPLYSGPNSGQSLSGPRSNDSRDTLLALQAGRAQARDRPLAPSHTAAALTAKADGHETTRLLSMVRDLLATKVSL